MRQIVFSMLLVAVPLFAQEIPTNPDEPNAPVKPSVPTVLSVSTDKTQLLTLVEKQLGEPNMYALVRHLLEGRKLRSFFDGCPTRLINSCNNSADLVTCLEGVEKRIDASNVECGELLESNVRVLKIISGQIDITEPVTRARRPTDPTRTRGGT